MTYEELVPIFNSNPGDIPVVFASGAIGILIRLTPEENGCGVQIPGEEDIRWLPISDFSPIIRGANTLRFRPSPHAARALES